MRMLFITGGSMGTVFPQAPLARAARAAGHEVLMAGPDTVTRVIADVGLPPVSISPQTKQSLSTDLPDDPREQMRYVGRWYAQMTMETLEPLRQVAEDWRPDLVVGGGMFYPAALLGHRLGVPTVRQPWGVLDSSEYDVGAGEELRPLLRQFELESVPVPDLSLDVTPPSLRRGNTPRGRPVRWIPGNLYRPLEPWMYTRGDRPRVLLTSGSRVTSSGSLHTIEVERLRELATHVTALGVEAVVAVPDDAASALCPGTGDEWRAGWVPLDIVAPTCDLIVHHGGVGSNMTAMSAGVPQLILREIPSLGEMQAQVEFGSVIDLPKERHTTPVIAEACQQILADSSYADRARTLAAEIAALPAPAQVVEELEKLPVG
ncbi:DUF1205 domain-containing protein [Lipingzhangella sp. LS1_29]|uniref:DUF1205 domain-containing protein n=1 Tax=Lipingzhangella rawalii TaxID=2055835 RepID=A0ABU2H678_9ACTN|nr:nucleotide disphospho-sugar-binding domain-containing protein [Lipingzhangella rawalii]MDS1270793.1 DUF1205 domain-containing protein [Lipingzhangella rawalii]